MEERLDHVKKQSKEMGERLDRMTKQNEDLTRENSRLAEQVQELSRRVGDSRPQATTSEGADGPGSSGLAGADPDGTSSSGAGGGMPLGTAGGGSASGGGDPTTTGRAQDVGNRHRGRIPLLAGTYDFDNDGFRWGTEDNEITFGVRALQQLDARIYANSNQEFVSSGIFNPRTRFYFTGNLTRPISYEFSFQQTYDTTNLLDSYVNYRAFNNGVMERGYRALWELHAAYYYGGLSLLGAWDSGFQDYAQGSSGPPPVRVPTSGYFVQAGYILTGETIRDRTLIDPLRPFDLRPGHFGLGALEVTATPASHLLRRRLERALVFLSPQLDRSSATGLAQRVRRRVLPPLPPQLLVLQ